MIPETLKVMVSAPGLVFALSIAARKEPSPLSFVLVTVYVAANGAAWTDMNPGNNPLVKIMVNKKWRKLEK